MKVIKTWTDALRSGKYKQCIGRLHRLDNSGAEGEGFCCLGVLCDLVKDKLGLKTQDHAIHDLKYRTYEDNCNFLPEKVSKLIGFSDYVQNFLAKENDVYKTDFNQIATIIERWLQEEKIKEVEI